MDDRPKHKVQLMLTSNPPADNDPDILLLDLDSGVFVRIDHETLKTLIPALVKFMQDVNDARKPRYTSELKGPAS